MASHSPIIPDYQERITGTLSQLGVSAPTLPGVFDEIESIRNAGRHAHPTWNFPVERNGALLFFRALIRDDPGLRKERSRTTKLLYDIRAQLKPKRKPAFSVPVVIEDGRNGRLVWDLEERVIGKHLPASWMATGRLNKHLDQVASYVRAFEAIGDLSADAPDERWAHLRKQMKFFLDWASTCVDFDPDTIDEVRCLTKEFLAAGPEQSLVLTHADLLAQNVMSRPDQPPVILDWDTAHYSVPAEAFGRHWTMHCQEPRWQEVVIERLGRKSSDFWRDFHAYAWYRAIDQIHHELVTFQGRVFGSCAELTEASPDHGHVVDQMLKSLKVLSRDVGGRPPLPGNTGPRRR